MDQIAIQYRFQLDDQRSEVFDLRLAPETLDPVRDETRAAFPAWTRLDFHQCPHCPLDPADRPECPVAVSLIEIVNRFDLFADALPCFIEDKLADIRYLFAPYFPDPRSRG